MDSTPSPDSGQPVSRRRRYGANYVPSSGWFYSWLDFRPDDVRRDFEDLARLGLDHVRVFPVWPWIQPNRALIRQSGIDDLLSTIDIAAEFGLDVAVDALQGHLSSFDFLPSWVLTWHRRSVFDDRDVRAGLRDYVAAVAGAVATREHVFALTLGNEVNNLWPANDSTAQHSTEWAHELLVTAKAAAPHLLALHSLYDDALYLPGHPYRPSDITELGDLSTVHSWVFNGVATIDGPTGPATVSHAEYMVELAAATATDPHRPVWLQEVGAPRPEVPDVDMREFVHQTVAHVAANPSLWGVTWWCSHDLSRGLVDFPEREYDLGLFTTDHHAKPVAEALAEAIREVGHQPAPALRPGLVCDVDLVTEPERRDEVAPGSAFHRDWVERRERGPIAIVSASRLHVDGYLTARGVDVALPARGVPSAT